MAVGVQFIRDRKGHRLVLMPLSRYRRLLREAEDRSDLAVGAGRRKERIIPYDEVRRRLGLT